MEKLVETLNIHSKSHWILMSWNNAGWTPVTLLKAPSGSSDTQFLSCHTSTHTCISWPLMARLKQNKGVILVSAAHMMKEESYRGHQVPCKHTHTHTQARNARLQAWLKPLFPSLAARRLHASLPTVVTGGKSCQNANNLRWRAKLDSV